MERKRYIDCEAGLLIGVMIISHCFGAASLLKSRAFAITYPFYFFMPWFFFKSGMLYTPQDIKKCLAKNIRKLLVPYCFFTVIGLLVHMTHSMLNGEFNLGAYFVSQTGLFLEEFALSGNPALWFLFSFFMTKILYELLRRVMNDWLIVLICFIVTSSIYYFLLELPRYCANVPAGIMFYTLGHILSNKFRKVEILYIAVFVYFTSALSGWTIIDMHLNSCVHGHYYLWVPTAIAGIVILDWLFNHIPNIRILEWMGQNSMVLLVTHMIIIGVVQLLFHDIILVTNKYTLFFILILSEIICIPILVRMFSNKKYCWIIGKNL